MVWHKNRFWYFRLVTSCPKSNTLWYMNFSYLSVSYFIHCRMATLGYCLDEFDKTNWPQCLWNLLMVSFSKLLCYVGYIDSGCPSSVLDNHKDMYAFMQQLPQIHSRAICLTRAIVADCCWRHSTVGLNPKPHGCKANLLTIHPYHYLFYKFYLFFLLFLTLVFWDYSLLFYWG